MFPFDAVANLDPDFLRSPGANFEHCSSRPAARHRSFVQRLRGRDSADTAVGPDKDHVERDQRVLHPKRDLLGRVVREDHPVIGSERTTKHEADLLLFGSGRNFDGEVVVTGDRVDDERHLAKTHLCMRNGSCALRKRLRRRREQHGREYRYQSSVAPVGRSSTAVSPLPLGAIRA
jgi:hypothetical protein